VLLVRDSVVVSERQVWLCKNCADSLRKHKLPSTAMANKLYLGDIPAESRDITGSECCCGSAALQVGIQHAQGIAAIAAENAAGMQRSTCDSA
jgi:hypothetical protein